VPENERDILTKNQGKDRLAEMINMADELLNYFGIFKRDGK